MNRPKAGETRTRCRPKTRESTGKWDTGRGEEDDTNLGLPDLAIAGFDEDNYSMGTDPRAVGDLMGQVEIPHDQEGEGEGQPGNE
jgi:hypothetical protein